MTHKLESRLPGEISSRFKGLDPGDRVPEEVWIDIQNTVQEVVTKSIPQKKKCKKAKWCLRRPYK